MIDTDKYMSRIIDRLFGVESPKRRRWKFAPKEDITFEELVSVVDIMLKTKTFVRIDKRDDDLARHFKEIDDQP